MEIDSYTLIIYIFTLNKMHDEVTTVLHNRSMLNE